MGWGLGVNGPVRAPRNKENLPAGEGRRLVHIRGVGAPSADLFISVDVFSFQG